MPRHQYPGAVLIALFAVALVPTTTHAQPSPRVLEGADAFVGWSSDAPGVRRHIRQGDLPAPYASPPSKNPSTVLPPPPKASLRVPDGFSVSVFAKGFNQPRYMTTAPNGDVFLAEVGGGSIRVLRAARDGKATVTNFVTGLSQPTGMAFYPPGAKPQWLYVTTPTQLLRYAYVAGDTQARSKPEIVIAQLSAVAGGHYARDIAFTADGSRLFISIGSTSNHGIVVPAKSAEELRSWEAKRGVGAYWGSETDRAVIMATDANGAPLKVFATGLRYCNGITVRPGTDELWCGDHAGDGLGEEFPADFLTRVKEGGFYGWPWFPNASHAEPRRAGERPDLVGKAVPPDVILGAHRSPMDLAFYDVTAGAAVFPKEYHGQLFAVLHGSTSRAELVGYKVVRAVIKDGVPTGEVIDFATGFVIDNASVWGRPAGLAVAKDGALLIADDGNGVIYRIAYEGK